MANVYAVKQTIICMTLELTEYEADMLAAMVQNPFDQDETKEAAELRGKIFNAIRTKPKTRAPE